MTKNTVKNKGLNWSKSLVILMSKIGIFCQKGDSYVKKEPPIYQLKEKHFE